MGVGDGCRTLGTAVTHRNGDHVVLAVDGNAYALGESLSGVVRAAGAINLVQVEFADDFVLNGPAVENSDKYIAGALESEHVGSNLANTRCPHWRQCLRKSPSLIIGRHQPSRRGIARRNEQADEQTENRSHCGNAEQKRPLRPENAHPGSKVQSSFPTFPLSECLDGLQTLRHSGSRHWLVLTHFRQVPFFFGAYHPMEQ